MSIENGCFFQRHLYKSRFLWYNKKDDFFFGREGKCVTPNEQYYKRVIGAVGATMLIFWVLINAFGVLYTLFSLVLSIFPISSVAIRIADQLVYGAGYLTAFMLPVAFLRSFLRKKNCPVQSMYLSVKLSPYLPLMILAGIAICFSAVQINYALVSVFDYHSFSSEILWGQSTDMPPYEIILQLIVMCVVPGFCEEFLFRGAILTNCLPFGRSNAILISAFLFSMMHQNVEQMLYTFVAGIVLGLVYEYTGSIWNCTILHICNNFISVMESAIIVNLGESVFTSLILTVFEGIIFLLGTVSAVILICKLCADRKDLRGGVFGKDLPAADGYARCPIEPKSARRLFLRPTMVIFLSLCVLQILLLIGMAVMM